MTKFYKRSNFCGKRDNFGAYMKTIQHDLHIKDGPLFNDNKLVSPATLRSFLSASVMKPILDNLERRRWQTPFGGLT